jgi:hypothetical protein
VTNLIYSTNLGGGARFEVTEVHNHIHVFGIDPFGVILVGLGALIFFVWWLVLGRKKANQPVE